MFCHRFFNPPLSSAFSLNKSFGFFCSHWSLQVLTMVTPVFLSKCGWFSFHWPFWDHYYSCDFNIYTNDLLKVLSLLPANSPLLIIFPLVTPAKVWLSSHHHHHPSAQFKSLHFRTITDYNSIYILLSSHNILPNQLLQFIDATAFSISFPIKLRVPISPSPSTIIPLNGLSFLLPSIWQSN